MSAKTEERVVEIIVNGTKANASLKEMAAAAAVLNNQVAKIAADDPKRAELIEQLQQMKQRIADTRAEIGGLVQSEEQLAAAQAATVAEQQRAIEVGQANTASLNEMKAAAGVLEQQLYEMAGDAPGRAALIADFQQLKGRMDEARAAINTVVKSEEELRAEEAALHQVEAARLASQQQAIAAGKQQSASFIEMKTAAGLLEQQLHEMAATDPNRAALIKDVQQLGQRMSETRSEMTTVVKTEAELRAEQDALRASQVQLVINGQKVSASMREMREAAMQLEGELEVLAQDDPARGPMIASLQQMKSRIKEVAQEVAGVSETTSTMRMVMTQAFSFAIGGGIQQAIYKVGELGKSVFDTTSKFETYEKVLANALGSESLAKKAMAEISDMAAKTPFSVDELTGSFVKLVNRGLNPSIAEMGKLGDIAASQGKGFEQLTEAVLDAGQNEFRRLKEFGIEASKSGDQVTLAFKGVTQTVESTPQAISAALIAFGDMKGVMGMTTEISKTMEGQFSNLGDTADQVAVEWGQSLRPAFIAVLDTMSFLLGALKALPSFLAENKAAFGLLALAVLAFNMEQVKAQATTIRSLALQKLVQLGVLAEAEGKYTLVTATALQTRAQLGLNAAMEANPIGIIVGLLALMAFGLKQLYDRSESFRAAVDSLFKMLGPLGDRLRSLVAQFGPLLTQLGQLYASLGSGHVVLDLFGKLMAISVILPLKLMVTQLQVTVDALAGFWDMGKRVANFFGADFKINPNGSFDAFTKNLKSNAKSIVDTLFGQDREMAAAQAASAQSQEKAAVDQSGKLFRAMAIAAAKARVEALQQEELSLKLKLAKVKEGTEQEMRLKQQLVTNASLQEIEDEKKTALEREIILAEAARKRAQLAQQFYEKQNKAREEARKKAAAEALKARLAEIEAEQHHEEAKIKLRQAAMVARGDEQVTELSKIYTDGQLKIVALEANTKKEIAQLTGSAKQKAARAKDLELELGADIALIKADVRKKQQDAEEKFQKEDLAKLEKFIDQQVETIDQETAKKQAAFDTLLGAGLESQRSAEQKKYEARQAGFAAELTLIQASLGKESAAYKKVYAAMLKDEGDFGKKKVAERKLTEKQIADLHKAEMQTAGDVLSFTLDLLEQDKEARQKHHDLYVALAVAKVIVDGIMEVQNIWEKSSEFGPAGIALAVIQTGLAAARTGVAIGKLTKSSGDTGGSYAEGGATGKGLLGMSQTAQIVHMMNGGNINVGTDGRLYDGTGFAVAGIVHEDEYVVPKWQLQDPETASVVQLLEERRVRGTRGSGLLTPSWQNQAVAGPNWARKVPQAANVQGWMEARQMRGWADGGFTTKLSSGANLPTPAASPVSGDEKIYAVLAQSLDVMREMTQQLADVKSWQSKLQVVNSLQAQQAGLDELKQVKHASAIRSKR